MLIPISWLKQYIPIEISALELAHRLTMAGTEISEVKEVGADWGHDKVVIGHVLKVDPHPDADRLKLPSLDLGDGQTAQVVCCWPQCTSVEERARWSDAIQNERHCILEARSLAAWSRPRHR